MESKALSRRNITGPRHRGAVAVSILFAFAERLLILRSYRSVALKIHFRNFMLLLGAKRQREREREEGREKGRDRALSRLACDIRVMERVIGEKSLWSLDTYESFLHGGR